MADIVVQLADVLGAAEAISPFVVRTAVIRSPYLSGVASALHGVPVELFFKVEALQRTGSFKARGATNAVLALDPGVAGVCTHSSGNHGAAVAWAASLRSLRCTIVMPRGASASKVAAVREAGGLVVECEPTQAAREAAAAQVAAGGYAFVHPSEDPRVIAGQGTLALEFLEQAGEGASDRAGPALDVLVVPVGGGGMISGCATACKGIDARIRVIGAEPAEADDAARSKAAGTRLGHPPGPTPATIADGLKTTLGPHTWPVVRDRVDAIVTVSEEEIRGALRLVFDRLKIAAEPSAAVGLAAVLSPAFAAVAGTGGGGKEPLRVGIVLCGGNVDLAALPSLLGLTHA